VLVGAVPPGGRDRVLWLSALVAALLTGTPLLVYSETWRDPLGLAHAPRRALDRLLAAVATTILVPGRVHAEHYRRRGRGGKVHVIAAPYPPVPAPARRSPGTRGSGAPELLFVGRTMPLKGLDRLLDLVDALDAEGTRVRLVALLGDPGSQFAGGDAAYAAGCLERLRARDPALTEVHTARVDVAPFYQRATLLVVPNRICPRDKVPGESWNRVVPEALAAGLPVVSTDAVPSAVEHVVGGVRGAVVPWADEAALRAAVRGWLP
jgi:glycosyltransferase involved in cell wall biosynthesis